MYETALLAGFAGTGLFAIWALGRRWGVRRVEAWAGTDESPYRRGVVHGAQAHGAPPLVLAAVALNAAWALATGILFAPAGIFLVFMSGYTALLVAGLVVSGFGLAGGLLYACWRVLRRGRTAGDHAESVARWSMIHHAGVAVIVPLAFAANDANGGEPLLAGLIAGVAPATVGLLLAMLLKAAVGRVRRADVEEAGLAVASS